MKQTLVPSMLCLVLLACGTQVCADFSPGAQDERGTQAAARAPVSGESAPAAAPGTDTSLPDNKPIKDPSAAPRMLKPRFETDKPHVSAGTGSRGPADTPAFGAGLARMVGEANADSATSPAHGRYANAESNYLLQRSTRR